MELAKKLTVSRFKALTDVTIEQVGNFSYAHRYGKYNQMSREEFESLTENEFLIELMEFTDDYQYPVPGDFNRISTYGEVMRDGKPRVVVIDFGASKNVLDTHYGRR